MKIHRLILATFLMLSGFQSSSGFGDNNGRGTKATALGNAFVALADNPWAVAYNPAGLAQIGWMEVSTFFVPEQFGLQELRTISLAASIPAGFATVGVGVDKFGFTLYKETTLRLALGGTVDRNLFGGVTLNLGSISIERYGSTSIGTVDVGTLAVLGTDVRAGFCYRNLFGARLGQTQERVPQIFLLGVCYSVLSDLLILGEVEKDVKYHASFKGGIQKSILDFLVGRVGMSNNPDKFSAGFNVSYAGVEFGYAGYSHAELGWTHQVELSFLFGEK